MFGPLSPPQIISARQLEESGAGGPCGDPGPTGCIETFTRTTTEGWGTSELGNDWDGTMNPSNYVNGAEGLIKDFGFQELTTAQAWTLPIDILIKLKYTASVFEQEFILQLYEKGISDAVYFNVDGQYGDLQAFVDGTDLFVNGTGPVMAIGPWYWVRLTLTATQIAITVWADGDSEPSPQAVATGTMSALVDTLDRIYVTAEAVAVDLIEIVSGLPCVDTVSCCCDSFSRFKSNSIQQFGWGSSELRCLDWIASEGSAGFSVDGSTARWTRVDGGFTFGIISLPVYPRVPFTLSADFTFGMAGGAVPYAALQLSGRTFLEFYYDTGTLQVDLTCNINGSHHTYGHVLASGLADDVTKTIHVELDVTATQIVATLTVDGNATVVTLGGLSLDPLPSPWLLDWLTFFFSDGGDAVNPSVFVVDNVQFGPSPCETIHQNLWSAVPVASVATKWETPIEIEARFRVTMGSTSAFHGFEFELWGPSYDAPWYGYPSMLLGVNNGAFSYSNQWTLGSNAAVEDVDFRIVRRGLLDANDQPLAAISGVSGVWCRMVVRLERSQVLFKAWKDADPEPGWLGRTIADGYDSPFFQYDLAVPAFGQVGVRYVSQHASSELLVDYLKIRRGYAGQTDYVFDDFNRSVGSGWGTPPGGGGPYVAYGAGTLSVDGSNGRITGITTGGHEVYAPIDWEAPGPYVDPCPCEAGGVPSEWYAGEVVTASGLLVPR